MLFDCCHFKMTFDKVWIQALWNAKKVFGTGGQYTQIISKILESHLYDCLKCMHCLIAFTQKIFCSMTKLPSYYHPPCGKFSETTSKDLIVHKETTKCMEWPYATNESCIKCSLMLQILGGWKVWSATLTWTLVWTCSPFLRIDPQTSNHEFEIQEFNYSTNQRTSLWVPEDRKYLI